MQMRVRRENVLHYEAIAAGEASGAAENGACGGDGFRTADDARIMELVSAQNSALREKWIRRVDAKFTIAVTLRRGKGFNVDGKHVGHGITDSSPGKAARQKHQAAALGVNGKAAGACLAKRFQKTGVGGERMRVRFRKSASNIKSVQAGWESGRIER